MEGITELLDKVTGPIEGFAKTGVPPQMVSEALGGIAIGEIVSAVERKFTKGWLRVGLLLAGGITSLYVAGKSDNPRIKMEGAIIGSDLFVNAVKEVLFNKEEVIETAKASIEALKSGNIAAIPSHVTNSSVSIVPGTASFVVPPPPQEVPTAPTAGRVVPIP